MFKSIITAFESASAVLGVTALALIIVAIAFHPLIMNVMTIFGLR